MNVAWFEPLIARQTQQLIFGYHIIADAEHQRPIPPSVRSANRDPVISHGLYSGVEVFAMSPKSEDTHGTSFWESAPSVC